MKPSGFLLQLVCQLMHLLFSVFLEPIRSATVTTPPPSLHSSLQPTTVSPTTTVSSPVKSTAAQTTASKPIATVSPTTTVSSPVKSTVAQTTASKPISTATPTTTSTQASTHSFQCKFHVSSFYYTTYAVKLGSRAFDTFA